MKILGAGLAGCIAAAMNQNATIIESSNKGNQQKHKAVLRFRSPHIGEAVGIPFKEVKVYKGIWHRGAPATLSPRHIILYSRKVADVAACRSITNLEPVNRWVAPDDFHEQLLDMCDGRIEYGTHCDADVINSLKDEPIISTIPINVIANILGKSIAVSCKSSEIYVTQLSVEDCNVYMTNYYTSPDVLPYRASITGNKVIIESCWQITKECINHVIDSFGIKGMSIDVIVDNHIQRNGKIVPIDEDARKQFLVYATIKHGIYSLGRFATWRNIVLDDVYTDILKIKAMINKSHYDQLKMEYNYES
jgi:hypothetical protein